ncbi:hypothetical protein JOM56_014789 [Amanita muscaria]
MLVSSFIVPSSIVSDHLHADPANWTWRHRERQAWTKFQTGDRWQEFADRWRDLEDLDREDPSGLFLDNLALPASQDNSLMIRKCYVEAEKLVWKWALSFPITGVIITGQSGIGKTLFIWYLLIRLLCMKQVVLLHAGDQDVLFYNDGVYGASRDARAYDLPSPGPNLFIWSLFDLYPQEMVPAFAVQPQCFPVQGPSPNRDLYPWLKQRSPLYTVFPLWTFEELQLATQHSPKFNAFRTFLDNVMRMENWKNPDFLSTVSNRGLVNFLEEIFPKGAPESFEEAFGILLDGLVSRFGVIPRQVFNAMFVDFNGVADYHDSALNTSFEELQKAADDLSRPEPSADARGPSHRLISLDNVGTLESKKLEVDFLSPVIAEKFFKRLLHESQVKAGSMIKYFLAMTQTRGLAGMLFEPFAHRFIANPDETNGTWGLRLMSSPDDSNSFVLHDPESRETVPGFPKIKRQPLSFHSEDLPPLYENAYYTPTIVNRPLFDSFVVDFPPLPRPQCLWLLQMSTSKSHKGSQMGYDVVEKIIERIELQREADQPPPAKKPDLKGKGKAVEPLSVDVNYVLVRPAGQEDHRWVLPEGWDELNVYLLELPLEQDIDSATTRAIRSRKNTPKASKAANASTSGTRRSARSQHQRNLGL